LAVPSTIVRNLDATYHASRNICGTDAFSLAVSNRSLLDIFGLSSRCENSIFFDDLPGSNHRQDDKGSPQNSPGNKEVIGTRRYANGHGSCDSIGVIVPIVVAGKLSHFFVQTGSSVVYRGELRSKVRCEAETVLLFDVECLMPTVPIIIVCIKRLGGWNANAIEFGMRVGVRMKQVCVTFRKKCGKNFVKMWPSVGYGYLST
jgi:hypothetical protein